MKDSQNSALQVHGTALIRLIEGTESNVRQAVNVHGKNGGPEIQTACWRALQIWKEDIAPLYDQVVSIAGTGSVAELTHTRYALFLDQIAEWSCLCGQYSVARRLYLEALGRLGSESNERATIAENLQNLGVNWPQKRGSDPLNDDDGMISDAYDRSGADEFTAAAPAFGDDADDTVDVPLGIELKPDVLSFADARIRVQQETAIVFEPPPRGIPVASSDVPAQQALNPVRGLAKVVGMAMLKEQLIHDVIGPFKDPELYARHRVSIPNGILFYGPPGCGKTYVARALAEELAWSFQYCRPSDVASPYIHDTVKQIRAVFSRAIENAPSVVFIDEFEAFVPARSELGGHQQYKAEEVNEFLANLEGCVEHRVLVIAATNEPEKIDPAVRRSGRFDKLIFIPPPDAEARLDMLLYHLKDRPVEATIDAAGIAAVLEGYSASDIRLFADEAARTALKQRALISTVTLLTALERVRASITTDDLQRYSTFQSRGTT
jgi:ATP-dependent 26S proteasome regulatory subunit